MIYIFKRKGNIKKIFVFIIINSYIVITTYYLR